MVKKGLRKEVNECDMKSEDERKPRNGLTTQKASAILSIETLREGLSMATNNQMPMPYPHNVSFAGTFLAVQFPNKQCYRR